MSADLCESCGQRDAQIACLHDDSHVSHLCLSCTDDLVSLLPAFAGSVSLSPLLGSAADELQQLTRDD